MTDEPASPPKKSKIEPATMISVLQSEADYRRTWARAKSGEYAAYLNRVADVFERAADVVAWARDENELRKRKGSR